MKVSSTLSLMIGELKQPAITGYQIGVFLFSLYMNKEYKGRKITNITKEFPNRSDYNRYVKDLISYGILNQDLVSQNDVYVVQSPVPPSPEEIACCIDPFIYISHLSAMEYHGLTNQIPKTLFITGPKNSEWVILKNAKMIKDLGDHYETYLNTGLPKLRRLAEKKLLKKHVNIFNTASYNPGSYINIKNKNLRVSTIGRTFLDMIKNPSLCGGIYHVLDAYSDNAQRYLNLIITEVEQHGSKIDKVRVGYILEERLNLSDPAIDRWKNLVQRGGSRKLVSDEPYMSKYSENWCLSINIEE